MLDKAVARYIDNVVKGRITVGRSIRRAIDRHRSDLAKQKHKNFPFYFDEEAAQLPIEFIETFITPSESDEPMRLLDWEKTWIAILFGWKRKADDTRRFRRTLLLIAKKNGKTALAAALAIIFLVADGELSARVFIAATTKKQGKVCMTEAVLMRKKSPALKDLISQSGGKTDDKQVLALYVKETGSRLSVMARDADSEDGSIVSHCILDELHRWKTKQGLYSVLRYGGRTRKQPLMVEISTAGDSANTTLPCFEEYEYGLKVLDPNDETEDEEFLPFFYTLDEKDDYKDERNWYKANPSMGPVKDGFLFDIAKLRAEYDEAKGKPGELGIWKRFGLNIWSQEADDPAVEIDKWDACARDLTRSPKALREESILQLAGRDCFAALDPSSKGDPSALCLLFPPANEGEKWRSLDYSWIPRKNIQARVKRKRVPYDRWVDDGFVTATDGALGELIDKRQIAADILTLSKQFNIRELFYDAAHAGDIISTLIEEGFDEEKLGAFPQTPIKMNEPCDSWALMVEGREYEHDRNPVVRWQVANLRWRVNPLSKLKMPDKSKGRDNIDNIVAQIMARASATSKDNANRPKKKKFFIAIPGQAPEGEGNDANS